MQRHAENAQQVAEFLKVIRAFKVVYPGLNSHPQHALAKAQMSGFGGMITFILMDIEAGQLLERVKLFALAESLVSASRLNTAIMTHGSQRNTRIYRAL